MWIKERDGKYRLYDRYKAPDGSSHEVSVPMDRNTPQERKRAREALCARIAELERDFTTFRLSDIVAAYLKSQENEVKASTFDRNKRVLEKLTEVITDVKAESLSAGLIKTQLLKKWENPTTLNEKIKRLKALLRWAYMNDFIRDREAYDKLTYFKEPTEKEKVKDKFMDTAELNALLDSMTIEKWKLVTQFLVLSGLRIGEFLALEDKDVDFKAREIRISKTYIKNLKLTDTPKTLESNRAVSMQDELLTAARDLHKYTQHIRLMTGSRLKLFVLDEDGTRIDQDVYNKYLKEKSEAVIGRKLTAHALRHTHVALMAAKGIPIEVLTRRLGHADSKITREIYMHITSDLRAADADLIKEIALLY